MALDNRSWLTARPPLHDLTIMIKDSDGAIDSIFSFHEYRSSLIHKSIAHCCIAKASDLGQPVILQF